MAASSHSSAFLYRTLLIFLSASLAPSFLPTQCFQHERRLMQQACSLNPSLLISHRIAPETLAKCFLWQPAGSCCTKVAHSHLSCRLCAAWVTSPPVAICASHACWQTGGGVTKGQGAVFLRGRLQPITPQLENKGNWLSVLHFRSIFIKNVTHMVLALTYSSGRCHRSLLLKEFLISHQPALLGYFCKRGEAEYWSYEPHTYMLRCAH